MSTIVIMPGGFHPFHAGHYALYQSAKKAFPDAEVYVAATNDQSERPFPFQLKEKLAKLAGVEPGHFVQVKSPFQAKEITQHFNPEQDVLVFVRSEKDRNESPKPGGTKKDGTPAYFQPWTGKDVQPFAKHAYFVYLPTVEFGPGITSATQIRKAWPTLNDKRKTAMVMSLYPATQKNSKLAQTVVGMFDQVMGGQQLSENVSQVDFKKNLLSILQQKYPDAEFRLRSDGVESADGQLTVIADTAEEGRYVGCFMWDVSTGPYKDALAQAIQQTTDQLLQANPGKKPALFISGDNQNPEAWSHIAKKLKYKLITDEDELEEGSLNEFAVDGFGDSGDNRSKLLASVGRLFDAGNKIDWQVPGQMGHVTRVQDDGITMKKWKKPHSRMSFFLPMTDDSRDSKYTIKMVGPKHYAVVSAEQGSLNEFAPSDGGDNGQEDILLKFARMWYNGDLATQQKIEQALARYGWEIGELESEEGGAFVMRAGDENGDSYIGFSADDLTEGVSEAKSDVIARTAKDLTNPPKVMQHRAKRDMEREKELQYRNIAKKTNEGLGPGYPETYEEENKPFQHKGSYRITNITSEDVNEEHVYSGNAPGEAVRKFKPKHVPNQDELIRKKGVLPESIDYLDEK